MAKLLMICLLAFLSASFPTKAREYCGNEQRRDTLSYLVEMAPSFSGGGQTPFWLVNNRNGLSSLKENNGYLRAGFFGSMKGNGRWKWDFGADLAVAYNFTSTFIIQQLYAEVQYWNFKLSAGSKIRNPLFNDTRLSSGDLLFSGNARPIPQLRLEIPDYIDVPGTQHWFGVKGYGAFGRFTDDGWQRKFVGPDGARTRQVLFHGKGGWIRIGNEDKFPLVFEGGLEMAAQWGGMRIANGKTFKMPHNLKSALKIIICKSGGSDTPMSDQMNCEGNHVGEWSASLKWKGDGWSARAYYEHFFEDHSMMFFDYAWKDMLLGLEFELPRNPVLAKFVYEYINTKDQSGAVYWDHTPDINEQVSGRDTYYNHYFYNGWQHWGMGIGNPLIISPIYNDSHGIYFRCNRIKGHHFGLEGKPIPSLKWRMLLSYTRGWGTYESPFKEIQNNINGLAEITWDASFWRGLSFTLAGAFDAGSMLGKSAGVMLTVRKTGIL